MKKHKINASRIIIYLLLLIGTLVCLFPFYWMVRSSFMDLKQIFVMPPIMIPDPIVTTNYADALEIMPYLRYFANTMIIVISNVGGSIIAASLCAFSFSKMRWPGRDKVFMIILTALMMPYIVTLIPTFTMWSQLGYINTLIPLTIPIWLGGGVFNIFLFRQFFMGIPRELDEAALIDGASFFRIYWQIIMPLSKSVIIVVGLFAFLHNWNDFLGPLLYIHSRELYTLSLGLRLFLGSYSAQWQLIMAASVLVILPVVLVFFIGQKHIIQGVATTGIKG